MIFSKKKSAVDQKRIDSHCARELNTTHTRFIDTKASQILHKSANLHENQQVKTIS